MSDKKSISSRENGKKGGRPPQMSDSDRCIYQYAQGMFRLHGQGYKLPLEPRLRRIWLLARRSVRRSRMMNQVAGGSGGLPRDQK